MSTDKVKLPEPVAYLVRKDFDEFYRASAETAARTYAEIVGAEVIHLHTSAQMLAMHEQGRLAGLEEGCESVPVGELVALRRNAGRYKWLREQDWFEGPLCVLRDPKRVLTKGVGAASIGAKMGEE
jgi:hypothetical protein